VRAGTAAELLSDLARKLGATHCPPVFGDESGDKCTPFGALSASLFPIGVPGRIQSDSDSVVPRPESRPDSLALLGPVSFAPVSLRPLLLAEANAAAPLSWHVVFRQAEIVAAVEYLVMRRPSR